jgi:hypothetical protein
MKKAKPVQRLLLALGLTTAAALSAQQWNGYTLVATQNNTSTKLIDTASATYHTWTGLTGNTGYSCYLLPGGTLVRTVTTSNSTFTGGGMHGRVQKVDYNGTLLWDFTYSTSSYCAHHDICPMPNGNVLLISYESKTAAEATQAGCQSAIVMWPDKIVEVQPTGATTGTVVWEWHLWDHLCQSYNSAVNNYVSSVADHPELFNINASPQKEIFHMNGIDYNPVLDQIVFSAHNTNEFYVIDHSTTTAEAASHSGGRSGKGGDFLYRWGKPSNYGQSGNTNFNVLHDAHWVPEDCPNAGDFVAINNKGISNTTSCIDRVSPPYSGFNYTYTANSAYLPATYTSRLTCTGGTSNMGNSEQFPNGNQMICLALSGTIYEVDPSGNTIWTYTASGTTPQAHRYTACYINNAAPSIPTISAAGNVLTSSAATSYQWYFNGSQIAGATSQSYTATQSGTYSVRVTDANGCVYSYSALLDFTLATGIQSFLSMTEFNPYPNPTNGILNLGGDLSIYGNYTVKICDAVGHIVMEAENQSQLDLASLADGIYFVTVATEKNGISTRRIILSRQ